MSIELPGWLTEPLSLIGMEWPQADEDLLNAAGDKWSQLANDLQGIATSATNAVAPVMAETTGDAAEAFDRWWKGPDGPDQRLDEDSDAARLLGGTLTAFAGLTVALKLAYIAQLAILAAQIAAAIAGAFFTFGASTAAVPGFVAATRAICQAALRKLVHQLDSVVKAIFERAKGLFKKVARRRGDDVARRRADDAAQTVARKADLTDADKAALTDYTSNNYREINAFLRNPDSITDPAERAAMQQRVDAINEALGKLPDRPGTTFRGVSSDLGDLYPKGSTVNEPAFMSTSTNSGVADGFGDGTSFIVHGRTGSDVAPYSQYPGESEILYGSGTQFKVLENTVVDGQRQIVLDQQ